MRTPAAAGRVCAVLVLVLGAAPGCVHTTAVPATDAECRRALPAPGEPLGSLRVGVYPEGGERDLATERGSVVLLDVWATWCEPCRDTLPRYEALAHELGPRGLKVYALSVDEDPRQVSVFLEENALSLPVLLDRGTKVSECRLALSNLPTSFLIDRAGRVRYVHQGASVSTLEETRRQLESLLAEPTDG
ncbi:MAG: TlpA family protein disulfide reductase [Myxococcaceae bacterium]|nr:TlpA family protein disulfide reductase [Myxococcaceae bacterium]